MNGRAILLIVIVLLCLSILLLIEAAERRDCRLHLPSGDCCPPGLPVEQCVVKP